MLSDTNAETLIELDTNPFKQVTLKRNIQIDLVENRNYIFFKIHDLYNIKVLSPLRGSSLRFNRMSKQKTTGKDSPYRRVLYSKVKQKELINQNTRDKINGYTNIRGGIIFPVHKHIFVCA